jgi:hypothetical protein
MPTVNSPTLTLTTVGNNVTIAVTYNAVYSGFERFLISNGASCHEHVVVFGADPPGATSGTTLTTFPLATHPVTSGAGSQTIARNLSRTVTRASLQEDTGLGDADEIRVSIELHFAGIPPNFSPKVFTPEQVLLG